jgi:hypothetical protein
MSVARGKAEVARSRREVAFDPYRKSASAASDEMPRLKTRSTTGLHFSYRRLILWVCDDAFLRWEAT